MERNCSGEIVPLFERVVEELERCDSALASRRQVLARLAQGDDILGLARILLRAAAERMERSIVGLSPQAADALLLYPWPGNVRELQNAMEYAAVVCDSPRIQLEDLPMNVRDALDTDGEALKMCSLEEVEREHILEVLDQCDGNREEAAEVLGIGVATLYRRLKDYRDEGVEV